jgi:serine/threonine protein phosphatase PrpC
MKKSRACPKIPGTGKLPLCSGSTCVSLMTLGNKLYVANVGDSRGILVRSYKKENLEPQHQCQAKALTRDHKPDDRDEAERIHANNGRIDSYRDHNGNPLGPLRVWLKSEDVPGLAMTRSFGDTVAHSVGCNAEPELDEYTLTREDKVVVIASDGVWEFLENIDVARIVYPFYLQKNAEGAAENLVRASFKRWRKEESVIDDITCIVIFLDVKS